MRIVAFLDEEFLCALAHLDMNLFSFDAREHLVDFKIDDAQQLRFAQRMENDDLVETIEKLGLKDALRFVENLVAHRNVIMSFGRCAETHYRLLLEQIGPDIRGHDDNCVPEINLAA